MIEKTQLIVHLMGAGFDVLKTLHDGWGLFLVFLIERLPPTDLELVVVGGFFDFEQFSVDSQLPLSSEAETSVEVLRSVLTVYSYCLTHRSRLTGTNLRKIPLHPKPAGALGFGSFCHLTRTFRPQLRLRAPARCHLLDVFGSIFVLSHRTISPTLLKSPF